MRSGANLSRLNRSRAETLSPPEGWQAGRRIIVDVRCGSSRPSLSRWTDFGCGVTSSAAAGVTCLRRSGFPEPRCSRSAGTDAYRERGARPGESRPLDLRGVPDVCAVRVRSPACSGRDQRGLRGRGPRHVSRFGGRRLGRLPVQACGSDDSVRSQPLGRVWRARARWSSTPSVTDGPKPTSTGSRSTASGCTSRRSCAATSPLRPWPGWPPAAIGSHDGQGLVRVPQIGELTLDARYDPELLRHLTVLKLSEDETAVIAPTHGRESALEGFSDIPALAPHARLPERGDSRRRRAQSCRAGCGGRERADDRRLAPRTWPPRCAGSTRQWALGR